MVAEGVRGDRFSFSEAVFLLLVVLVVWFGEEPSQNGPGSPWFEASLIGVPLAYVLFASLIILLLPYVLVTPRFDLVQHLKAARLWPWVVLTWAVVAFALGLALIRGVPELFADWRNLAVSAVVMVVASKWLAAQPWRRFAVVDLTIAFGVLSVPILVAFWLGFGSNVGGVRTTVFEATTLYLASFAAIAGGWNLLIANRSFGKLRTTLLTIATIASSLVVLLSLRRSYWVMLGVGALVVLVAYLRSRQVKMLRIYVVLFAGLLVVAGTFFTLGSEIVLDRIGSFSPQSEGRFSNTNADHVNDLVDAWGVIAAQPVLGFGIGVRYETNLIAEWKQDSFDVHNAVLHVWLKFGIAGAIAFLGFHIASARFALRRPFTGSVPIGAYVIGVLASTLFATWPYGRFQVAVFLGLLWAMLIVEMGEPATSSSPAQVEPVRSGLTPSAR